MTARWWADPEWARLMLSLVDDSDPMQGVATSALGYHGLVEGALHPLRVQTLVDPGLVAATAETVDLTPVAKAFGRATKPILGASSSRYGELLAKSIHSLAIDNTTRLIGTLTNTGVPFPLALDRAIAVHGVPVQEVGRYAFVMKAPMVTEVVKADLADRALMMWAQRVARREAEASPEYGYDRAR